MSGSDRLQIWKQITWLAEAASRKKGREQLFSCKLNKQMTGGLVEKRNFKWESLDVKWKWNESKMEHLYRIKQ